MGLFDFFKKKDGAYFLTRGQKALEHGHFAEARDDAHDGLDKKDSPSDVKTALEKLLADARRGIYDLNRSESEHSAKVNDFDRAVECLETAREHTHVESEQAEITARITELRDAKARMAKKVEIRSIQEFDGLRDEEEQRTMDEFEIYLSGLVDDVAEKYRTRGYSFAQAYVAMNQGDAKKALELFANLKPRNEQDQGFLAFEQSRALIMAGRFDRALVLLDVAAAVRGAEPIFTTNHPSIPYLRFEALVGLRRVDDALEALRQGLKVSPKQLEMRNTLASVLIELGKTEEALTVVEESEQYSRTDADIYVLRAKLYSLEDNKEKAAEVLENGLRNCPRLSDGRPHPSLARALAEAYLNLQSHAKRVETLLKELIEAQEGEGEWLDHYLYAWYLKWSGDENEARTHWRKALSQVPDARDPRRKQVTELFPNG